ncbi:HAMP domain-containing sensor histidine kinase [Isosphaeraceae bacterium EP7]
MSLTGRFSALVLAAIGVVLVGFSTALFLAARVYLDHQMGDRLASALDILVAAAEVHPNGVEWEPHERVLPLGQMTGEGEICWVIYDDRGHRVDRSRNFPEADLTDVRTINRRQTGLPAQQVDRLGHVWRMDRRTIVPGAKNSGSQAAADRTLPVEVDPPEAFYPSLTLIAYAPMAPTRELLASLAWGLVVLGMTTWGVSALLCRRLSRTALQPLSRLAESARGLDTAGPGWVLERSGTGDELDDLGQAFNELLSRIHVAYERQRRFGSDASHQLRTPLTILIGQIEVALRHERTPEEYRRTLTSALGGAAQLARVVEALLFLARAESDAAMPESVLLNLGSWARAHVEAIAPSSMLLEFCEAEGGPIWVRANPPLLGQLLDNLLDNARKYSPPGSPITVGLGSDRDSVRLCVEDQGPGIPTEEADRIFEPFFRSRQARRLPISGAGLGLSIAQRVAQAMGGLITYRPRPEGGSNFELRIPRAASPPAVVSRAETASLKDLVAS